MKTIIITNSKDATTDLIIFYLGSDKVFRLNYDLWYNYSFEFNNNGFQISTSNHTITFQDTKKLYWRKPFNFEIQFEDERLFTHINSELKYCFREIFSFCSLHRKAILINPYVHDRLGKLNQLTIASKYFKVPDWSVTWNKATHLNGSCVVKSLSSAIIDSTKAIYTTEVNINQLDLSFPWFIQHKVEAEFDVTIVYIHGKIFSYKLERDLRVGLDWRANQEAVEWDRFLIPEDDIIKIKNFMDDLGLIFGRLDFLLKDREMYFLEVNPNGQFAWLDPEKSNGLLDCMLNVISPETELKCVVDMM